VVKKRFLMVDKALTRKGVDMREHDTPRGSAKETITGKGSRQVGDEERVAGSRGGKYTKHKKKNAWWRVILQQNSREKRERLSWSGCGVCTRRAHERELTGNES